MTRQPDAAPYGFQGADFDFLLIPCGVFLALLRLFLSTFQP